MIQRLSAEKFAAELYEAYQLDPQQNNWTYLPYGPFSTQSEFLNWLRLLEMCMQKDQPEYIHYSMWWV